MIDANMYWIPEEIFTNEALMEEFLSEVPEEFGWHGYCEEVPGTEGKKQVVLEKPKGSQNLNYVQGDYILETQLADLDAAGVEKALLKVPGCHEWLSLKMCRLFNDGMYEHAKRSGGRLVPLAVVPPYGTPESLSELERCHRELGMNAVQVSAHYGDTYLDDEKFGKFFAKVNELHMNVYVHHTPIPAEYRSFCDYNNVRRSYGRCVDQGLAVGREVFSNFFERYPNIKMVHSMLGGGFFAIANMMFPQQAKGKETVGRFKTDGGQMKERFREHIYFEMSHAQPWGKEALECAVKVLGADHIIFGTSYPVRKEWLAGGPEFVRQLDITEEEKDKILEKNAREIYGVEQSIDFSSKHHVLIQSDDGTLLPMDEPFFESELIAPGTFRIQSDGDYSYLIEGDDEAIMIDTGYGAGNIREYAQSLTEKPLRNVVNTHDHFDHTANNSYFDCAFMSAETKPLATIPFPSFEGIDFPRDYPIQVIDEGYVFHLGGRDLEVFKIPDHAVGSIALLDKKERLLFTGDEISPMGKMLNGSVERFLGYLKKLERRREEYDRLCTGVGVISADWIEKYRENMEYILAGGEGVKPKEGPGFEQRFTQDGAPIYGRRMPHYPDIVGKLDANEYHRVMEYAGCRVTYDYRKIREGE